MQGTARCWHGERASAGLFCFVGLVLEITRFTGLLDISITLSTIGSGIGELAVFQVAAHLSQGQTFVTAWAVDHFFSRLALVQPYASPGKLLLAARAHDGWHDSDRSTRQACCN